jgi:hypothetical protein
MWESKVLGLGVKIHVGINFYNLGYKLLLQLAIHLVSTKVEVRVCTRFVSLRESPKAHTRQESKIPIVGGY